MTNKREQQIRYYVSQQMPKREVHKMIEELLAEIDDLRETLKLKEGVERLRLELLYDSFAAKGLKQ